MEKITRRSALALPASAFAAEESRPQAGWWVTQPVRWIQTNFRQTDAGLDANELVSHARDFRANVLHIGMGGIAAYYPTDVPFHYRSPQLPAGRDTFGEILQEAHRHGIKIVGRFDLSKTQKAAYDAHPEWFFRKADGQPSPPYPP